MVCSPKVQLASRGRKQENGEKYMDPDHVGFRHSVTLLCLTL